MSMLTYKKKRRSVLLALKTKYVERVSVFKSVLCNY